MKLVLRLCLLAAFIANPSTYAMAAENSALLKKLKDVQLKAYMPSHYKKVEYFTPSREPIGVGDCSSGEYDPDKTCAFIETSVVDAYNEGDGVAIVRSICNYGGTAVLNVLYYVKMTSGIKVASDPYVLGDRVLVNSVKVKGDKVTINMIAHGPNDAMCCPKTRKTVTLTFDGRQLVNASGRGTR